MFTDFTHNATFRHSDLIGLVDCNKHGITRATRETWASAQPSHAMANRHAAAPKPLSSIRNGVPYAQHHCRLLSTCAPTCVTNPSRRFTRLVMGWPLNRMSPSRCNRSRGTGGDRRWGRQCVAQSGRFQVRRMYMDGRSRRTRFGGPFYLHFLPHPFVPSCTQPAVVQHTAIVQCC